MKPVTALRILAVLAAVVQACFCPRANAQSPADEELRFDRAIFDTGTQNSGAILQDRDGYLWIGTNGAGLYRYDGYELKAYKPGRPNSLSSPYVYALYEDRAGFIWIGTGGGGLNQYDKETDSFTHYKHDPQNPHSISGNTMVLFHLQMIREDPQGNLWIGTSNGLNVLDKATGTFKHYSHDPNRADSLSHNDVSALLFDAQGVLWVGTEGGGLNRFDRQTETFAHYTSDPLNPHSLAGNAILSLAEDEEGRLWVATMDNGLYRFDRSSETFTRYLHNPQASTSLWGNKISSMYQDSTGMMWIAYNNTDQFGLSVFDPRKNTFAHYTHNPEDPSSLSSTSINSVYQDRAGIVWVVNNTGLVDKLDPHKPKFKLYRHDPQNPKSLNSNVVVPMLQDRAGRIWIGTDVGLQTYDKQTNTFTEHIKGYYSGLYEDQAGTFWLGSSVPGILHIFDRDTQKIIKQYRYDPQNPKGLAQNRQIFSILGDNQDSDILWMTTTDAGLERFQKSTETFTHYQHNPQNPNSLSNNNLMAFYQDRQGILWIPTPGGGLDRLDPRSGDFTHLRHDPQQPTSISSDVVNVVFEDADGMLWVGTAAGFDRFDREAQSFKRYTEATGYPVSMITLINQDADGNLWMGSMGGDGLIKFDPQTETLRVYKESDGLQGNVFYPLNGILDRDGMMWFGGANGLNAFYPQDIQDNDYVPPVLVTALKQGGEPLALGKATERVQEIRLDWRHNFFEFEYTALNFTQAGKNQYRYKLEGLDQDWFNAGARRFGRYSGLRGGQYTLHIVGSNNDGVWNEKGVSIGVDVTRPWWETGWFYALAALFVLAAFLVIYQIKSKQVKAAQVAALALQASEARYRRLFEDAVLGIFQSTSEGNAISVNPAFARMFGYESPEDVAATVKNVATDLFADPQRRPEIMRLMAEQPDLRTFENLYRRKDGSTFPGTLHVWPIKDADGRLMYLEGFVEDITERRRVEEALQLSEKKFRSAFYISPDSININRLSDGMYIEINQGFTAIMGYTADDMQGKTSLELNIWVNPQDRARLVQELRARGEMANLEASFRTKDGRIRTGLMSAKVIQIGGETCILSITRDITERKWAEEEIHRLNAELEQRVIERTAQLEAANKELEAFSYSVSHDLRAPLRAMDGFSRILMEDYAPELSPDLARYLKIIRENTQQMGRLIDDLLAFSRLSRQPINKQTVAMADLVSQVLDSLSSEQAGRPVELVVGDLPACQGDPALLRQVWINLLSNALKFTRGRGTTLGAAPGAAPGAAWIEVGWMEKDGKQVYFVKDNGAGFDMQYANKLFGVFQRLHRAEEYEGTGVGLAIVQRIVARHGGLVWAEAEVDKGATFYFTV